MSQPAGCRALGSPALRGHGHRDDLAGDDLAGAVGGVGGQAPQFASGAALIAVSAPVIVFLALQRYLVHGLTAGPSAAEPGRSGRRPSRCYPPRLIVEDDPGEGSTRRPRADRVARLVRSPRR